MEMIMRKFLVVVMAVVLLSGCPRRSSVFCGLGQGDGVLGEAGEAALPLGAACLVVGAQL